jgi:hypothetical protein
MKTLDQMRSNQGASPAQTQQPLSQVAFAFQQQSVIIDALLGCSDSLEKRLNSILLPRDSSCTAPSEEVGKDLVPLAESLEENNSRLEIVRDRLSSILSRLEL